ncbi:MAG: UDP-glucose 4-epimerase GalE [Alphaproteobacteria bacterium]|nr:UDP-glucose 4-epimerase GalE [Alphaproteobacteria bacterium]
MDKILIVGGAGYIGSHTVKHLLKYGYDCVVADNLSCGHLEAVADEAVFEKADLMDKKSLGAVFQKHKIDAVIHFAALSLVGESVVNPQKYYHNNVIGTINLLDVMLEFGVKKIVFSSTCATYGEPQYVPIDEKHPQLPINPYGHTKLTIENLFKDYHNAYGLRYIALRYFNAAGADEDAQIGESHNPESHLIPLVFKAIKGEKENIKVFGTDYNTPDGTCLRDYIHVNDLASAHRLAVEKLNEYSGFINLGTGIPTSVLEIIKMAEKVSGKKCPVVYEQRRAGDPDVLYADNKKAKEILGWIPKYVNLENILYTAWKWEFNKKF